MKSDIIFSKNSDEWSTPDWLYQQLDNEFFFALDAAATEENTKAFYYNNDGLNQDWLIPKNESDGGGYFAVWLNPPYSKIKQFMKKAYEESLKGAVVVCLIPVRSDTHYWHDYVMKAHEIRLIKGRLKFENRTLPSWNPEGNFKMSSAPFPSCIVIFDHSKYDKNNDPIFKTMENKTNI